MLNPEHLRSLVYSTDSELGSGNPLDVNKLATDISRGFRLSNRAPGISREKIYVITRLNDNLFEIEIDSFQVAPYAPDGNLSYVRNRGNITRRNNIWRQPGSQALERWSFEFGSNLHFSKKHFIAEANGGTLDEEEFLRWYHESAPDWQATEQYKAYLEKINFLNLSPFKFGWLSDETPKT